MKKIFVLDTNVLIQSPDALDCFEDNRLVLPLAVLEELDKLKKAEGEKVPTQERLSGAWRISGCREIFWRAFP